MTADGDLKALGPFTAGVNNVSPQTKPPVDQNGQVTSLREAVNCDIDSAGRVQRRRGVTTVVSAGSAHSLFANESHLFAVVDGTLNAYSDDSGSLALARSIRIVGDRFASLTSDDFDVMWSNGVESGRIDADLNDLPLWIDTPHPASVSVNAAGGLAAGQYEVSLTARDAAGRESGASNPVVLTLAAGQGIDVVMPAAPTSGATWCIYVTPPDGEVFYLAAELPIATASYTVGVHVAGRVLETAWLFPMLPCQILRYGHGRLVGLTGDAILWSEPYRLGLMADTNLLGFTRGTMLEPVGEGDAAGSGWYASDQKRTYFMEGADPKAWKQRIVSGSAAVPGTSMTVPGSVFGFDSPAPVAFWMGRNGVFYVGAAGGAVKPIREGELAMPINGERGAVGFFEFEGVRQMITSILAGDDNPTNVGMGDLADATIRRNGVLI